MTPTGKKVLGIIAEYNPFHNGHHYHIEEAKRQSGCDYVIVVMSGDFVQRGTPALLDKYTRAEFALRAGADIVLELPVAWPVAVPSTLPAVLWGSCIGWVSWIPFALAASKMTCMRCHSWHPSWKANQHATRNDYRNCFAPAIAIPLHGRKLFLQLSHPMLLRF